MHLEKLKTDLEKWFADHNEDHPSWADNKATYSEVLERLADNQTLIVKAKTVKSSINIDVLNSILDDQINEYRVKQQKRSAINETFFRLQSKITALSDLKDTLNEQFNN